MNIIGVVLLGTYVVVFLLRKSCVGGRTNLAVTLAFSISALIGSPIYQPYLKVLADKLQYYNSS
jgi:hypothetical protein